MNTQHSSDKPAAGGYGRLAQIAIFVLIAVFVLLAYTFLHEGGHAIIGLLFGGTITNFSISFWDIGAHVGIQGEFSAVQRSLISAAGVGFAFLVWLGFIAVIPKRTNDILELLRFIFSIAVINTLLAWVVIPFLYLAGQAQGDDATNFLRVSGLHPLLVAGLSFLIYAGGWAFFLSRIGNPRERLIRLRSDGLNLFAADSRRALYAIATVGAAIILIAGGLTVYFGKTNPLAIPPGYTLAAKVDLSDKGMTDEIAYRVTVEDPQTTQFYFLLQDIKSTGPMEISVAGPDGYKMIPFRAGNSLQEFGRATVNPQATLLTKGEYQVRLTFPHTPGQVSIYVKHYATGPTGSTP